MGATTAPGALYLGSRGLVPGGTFALLYAGDIFAGRGPLWVWALICGTGSEVLLRSNFFIKKAELPGVGGPTSQPQPQTQDIMVGPLDLLKWWQDLALSYIGTHLSAKRLRFVDKNTPETSDFPLLCSTTQDRIGGLTDQAVAQELKGKITDLCNEFKQDPASQVRRYCFSLALLLERALPRKEFLSVIRAASNK
jgi:hypothetical protein